MKFSIITPTFKRADKLVRAVRSVQAQTYQEWEMIIVNDSPFDNSYVEFSSSINDPRIRYLVNERNMGVNFSRNRALDTISADSTWVVFLDDDDWLAPDALANFYHLILTNPQREWFMTHRALRDGSPLTETPGANRDYSYIRDCLLFKRLKGDATHAIKTENIHHIRFSKFIKQGEEWIFFYQLGLRRTIYFSEHNSTITDGYDAETGLNFRKQSRSEQFETLLKIFYEGILLGIIYHPTFLLYLFLRTVRIIISN